MAHDTATGGNRVSDESRSRDGIVSSKLYRVCKTPSTRDTQIFETLTHVGRIVVHYKKTPRDINMPCIQSKFELCSQAVCRSSNGMQRMTYDFLWISSESQCEVIPKNDCTVLSVVHVSHVKEILLAALSIFDKDCSILVYMCGITRSAKNFVAGIVYRFSIVFIRFTNPFFNDLEWLHILHNHPTNSLMDPF